MVFSRYSTFVMPGFTDKTNELGWPNCHAVMQVLKGREKKSERKREEWERLRYRLGFIGLRRTSVQ